MFTADIATQCCTIWNTSIRVRAESGSLIFSALCVLELLHINKTRRGLPEMSRKDGGRQIDSLDQTLLTFSVLFSLWGSPRRTLQRTEQVAKAFHLLPTLAHAVTPPWKHQPQMISYLYSSTSTPPLPIPWSCGILIAVILMVHFPRRVNGAASRPGPPHTLSEGRVNTVSQPALHPRLPSPRC